MTNGPPAANATLRCRNARRLKLFIFIKQVVIKALTPLSLELLRSQVRLTWRSTPVRASSCWRVCSLEMANRKYPLEGPPGYLMKDGKIPALRSCRFNCEACLALLGRIVMIGPGVSMGARFEPRSAFLV